MAASAFSQVSVNVSTLDPVYRDIDKLVAHGLIDKIIVGQRPYSRKEIARLIQEARTNLSRLDARPDFSEAKRESLQARKEYVQKILKRLAKDYEEELVLIGASQGDKPFLSFHPLEKVEAEMMVAQSPSRILNNDNGLGRVDAQINPLLQSREGRHLVDGGNFSLETTHSLRVSNHFALYARPRFQLGIGRDGQNDIGAFAQNLYGKFYFKNVEIQVGRDNLLWGQGENSGLLLSNNGRGLDLVKISNDSPFFLPWVFRYIGANKVSFFYANLGPEQSFKNSYLAGYKWSFQPVSFFEAGVAVYANGGGKGAPPYSFGSRVKDLFGFSSGSDLTTSLSNKLGGFDFRFRIPPLRHAEIYGEAIFDDSYKFFKNSTVLRRQLIEDAGYVVGLYLPRLDMLGKSDLRFEYHRTGKRYYRHATFQSGITLNRFLLGDPIGPDAQAFYIHFAHQFNVQNSLFVNLDFESRSNDLYIDGPFDRFVRSQDLPSEKRYRISTEWFHQMEDFPLQFKLQLAYERVSNFNFTLGDSRNNFLGGLQLQFNLDSKTRISK